MAKDVEMDFEGLDQLLKAFKERVPLARVGILGKKAIRNDLEFEGGKAVNASKFDSLKATLNQNKVKFEADTNAAIGLFHEFGTKNTPVRSFLRVPLAENFQKYMAQSGAFNKDVLAKVIKEGSIVEYVKKMAAIGEKIVLEAFDTGGFGKWIPSNMEKKKVKQTLIETQQLRNSITSDVK